MKTDWQSKKKIQFCWCEGIYGGFPPFPVMVTNEGLDWDPRPKMFHVILVVTSQNPEKGATQDIHLGKWNYNSWNLKWFGDFGGGSPLLKPQ